MRFAIGVVVELKSGGPKMTIARYDEREDTFQCVWFLNNIVQRDYFPTESLRPVLEEMPMEIAI